MRFFIYWFILILVWSCSDVATNSNSDSVNYKLYVANQEQDHIAVLNADVIFRAIIFSNLQKIYQLNT